MEAPTPRRLTRSSMSWWDRMHCIGRRNVLLHGIPCLLWLLTSKLSASFNKTLGRHVIQIMVIFPKILLSHWAKEGGAAKTTASAISSKYSCFKSCIRQFFLSCVCKLLRKRQSHNHSHQTALILHRYCTSQSYCHFCNRVPIFHHIFKRTSR